MSFSSHFPIKSLVCKVCGARTGLLAPLPQSIARAAKAGWASSIAGEPLCPSHAPHAPVRPLRDAVR